MIQLARALTMMLGVCLAAAAAVGQGPRAEEPTATIEVALLRYGGLEEVGECFSEKFLELARMEAGIGVRDSLARVDATSASLFDHPFVIMAGQGSFELSQSEVRALRDYIERGGLLLASAACTDGDWDVSFRRALERIAPDRPLTEIPMSHPLFSAVWEINELPTRRAARSAPARLHAVTLGERLAVIYSPHGLAETDAAADGCCCCGGDEIRNAAYVNANILAYALMR